MPKETETQFNKKYRFKYILKYILPVLVMVGLGVGARDAKAAFSCDTGSLADGDTCTVTANKTLGNGENITGPNATLILSNNAQIIGYTGSPATISVQNLTINSGSYINFNRKGYLGGINSSVDGFWSWRRR